MLDILFTILYKFLSYVSFGFLLEITFTAISKLTDGKITDEDKDLKGTISLWMIPVYGFLIWLLFEPLYSLVHNLPFYIRYGIWAITISGFEALSGFLYDKYLNIQPWDYSNDKFKVFKRGYTTWVLVPCWGFIGLILEHYTTFIQKMSEFVPYVISFMRSTL
jgi:uncharacterized membrane protein